MEALNEIVKVTLCIFIGLTGGRLLTGPKPKPKLNLKPDSFMRMRREWVLEHYGKRNQSGSIDSVVKRLKAAQITPVFRI